MSPISSDTLFHFTGSIHNLVSILTDEFRPHYALEDHGFVTQRGEAEALLALPMVCFCDIPLSQTTKHMATYGSYAIGLTKEWGIRNGIAPVLYSHPRSVVAQALYDLFMLPDRLGPQDPSIADTLTKSLDHVDSTFRRLLCFMKPYQGPFVRSGRVIPDVRFYDEREWRWIPEDQVEKRVLDKEQYFDFAALRDANALVWEQAVLSFEPSDIKFLVVATESEILPMIRQLRLIKAKYSEDEVALLCSRIVSAEQVLRDL